MSVSQQLIDNIEDLRKAVSEVSVYDFNVYTSMEQYYKIAKKLNEIIKELLRFEIVVSEEVVIQNDKLIYLLGEGLNHEVVEKINQMVSNGTFDTIINHNIFTNLGIKINELSSKNNVRFDDIEQDIKSNYAKKSEIGSPIIANTVAEMTDNTKVYVYMGNESGFINGNWYSHNGSIWLSGGTYNSQGVGDSSITPKKTNFFDLNVTSLNKFDKNNITPNSQITINGDISYNADHFISNLILVPNNTRIEFCYTDSNGLRSLSFPTRRICVYDKDNIVIPSLGSDSSVRFWVNTSGNDVFIRAQINNINNNEFTATLNYDLASIQAITQYTPYTDEYLIKKQHIEKQINASIEELTSSNVLDNKYYWHLINNICCIGDSLTKGVTGEGGDSNGHTENYVHYLAKLSNLSEDKFINYGVAGANSPYILTNIANAGLSTTTDLVILWLGTNDASLSLSKNWSNLDIVNYRGDNYCSIINYIKMNSPNAQIIMVNVPNAINSTKNLEQFKLNNIDLQLIADHYNLKLIDLYTLLDNHTSEKGNLYQPYDGLHYCKWGYLQIAKIIFDEISKNISEIDIATSFQSID